MMTKHRIVSLLPSSTEMVYAFGLGDALVGRSHACDYPPEAQQVPVCSTPKLDPRLSSAALDHQVRAMIHEGLSLFLVDADKLRELQPTVILTQTHCKVCAVSLEDVKQAVCDWLDNDVPLVSLEPNTLEDIWTDAVNVATALGVRELGQEKVADWKARMEAIATQTLQLTTQPTVATIEWIEPIMAGGNWFPDLVVMAGGRNLFGHANKNSPVITWEALQQADPDVIVVVPCGFDIPRTRRELPALTSRPGWDALRAVQQQQVYVVDGHHYFNRPGPRIVESLEIMAEILHPDRFHFGHKMHAWEPL